MPICEYCHAELPGDAAFCGSCGRVQSAKLPSTDSSSSPNNFATALISSNPEMFASPPADARTALSASRVDPDPLDGRNLRNMNRSNASSSYPEIADMPTLHGEPYTQEDEDEEKGPIPLFSRIFPVALGADLLDIQNPVGQAPSLQGIPDPGSASMLSGTPQVDVAQPANYAPSAPNQHDPNLFAQQATLQQAPPSFPPVNTLYTPPSFPPHVDLPFPPTNTPYTPPPGSLHSSPSSFPGQPSPQTPPHPGGLPHGCALWGAILLIPILILLSVFSLSVTIFAPQLSLNGTDSVNLGDTLHVHGRSFLANTTIRLTLDDNQLVQVASEPSTPDIVSSSSLHTQALLLSTLISTQPAANTLKTSSSGAFDANIVVNSNWSPGRHILHAQEGLTPRSATLAFTVLSEADTLPPPGTVTPTQNPTTTPKLKQPSKPIVTATGTAATGTITSPTPVATTVPTPVPTSAPTPTPTPTVTSQLSSINPNTLALGTLTQNSTQTLSSQTTLSGTGNALVSWSASWSQQASWLQVSPSSGQISTPGSQQIAVSANAGTLQPGTYSTTISFSSPSNAQPLTLTVSFTVQGFCLTARTKSLSFTGTTGGPDPANQTFSLVNCGATGSWTATPSTADGANWLQVSPLSGNLASGATQTIAVGTAITSTQLAAGTYSGTILFTTGNTQVSVSVKLTVQAIVIQSPATLQVTPTSLSMLTNCTAIRTTVACQVTLTALNATQAITWTATSNYALTRFSASTGTITTGQSITVTIVLSRVVCPGSAVTVTFTGPNNAVPVSITC
jgi:Viral BACON domain